MHDSSETPSPQEITWASFGQLVGRLVDAVKASAWEPQAVVGIAKGGIFVGGAVAEGLRATFLPVRISRRSRDQERRVRPRVHGEMPKAVRGLRVLVVDDIVASGETLALAVSLAREMGASDVRTAVLVTHPDAPRPDFAALERKALTVFPWDYNVIADGRFEQDPDSGV